MRWNEHQKNNETKGKRNRENFTRNTYKNRPFELITPIKGRLIRLIRLKKDKLNRRVRNIDRIQWRNDPNSRSMNLKRVGTGPCNNSVNRLGIIEGYASRSSPNEGVHAAGRHLLELWTAPTWWLIKLIAPRASSAQPRRHAHRFVSTLILALLCIPLFPLPGKLNRDGLLPSPPSLWE